MCINTSKEWNLCDALRVCSRPWWPHVSKKVISSLYLLLSLSFGLFLVVFTFSWIEKEKKSN
jgi:hypothetical protein